MKSISILMTMITFSVVINNGSSASASSFFNSKNNIIPKPLSYESCKGEFLISSDTVIYVKGRNNRINKKIARNIKID